jgi:hypothetical protein
LNPFDKPAQNAANLRIGVQYPPTNARHATPPSADVPAGPEATAGTGAGDTAGTSSGNAKRPVTISQSQSAPGSGGWTVRQTANSSHSTNTPAAPQLPSLPPANQIGFASGTALSKTPAAVHSSSASATEKIAGSLQEPAQAQATKSNDSEASPKSDAGLDPDIQRVTPSTRNVGITSAERLVDMRKSAETSAPVGLAPTWGAIASSVASSAPAPTGGAVLNPTSLTATHAAAAIEATLDAVERGRDAASSSVELKLTFGDDTRLAVRIELSNGTVQTTFRTDSVELRQALASEWHQTVPATLATSSDRDLRVAEPVFTPAAGSPEFSGNSTGGHANSRQGPPLAPADQSFLPTASPGSRTTPSAASIPAGQPGLPTSLRLNVFA